MKRDTNSKKSVHLIPKICPKPGLGNQNPSHILNFAKAIVSCFAEHSPRHPTQHLATCVVTGQRIKSSLVASSGGDQLCETACLFHAYQPQRKNSTNAHLITQKYHASHQLSVLYPSQAFARLGLAYSCELTLDNAGMPCAVTMQGLRGQRGRQQQRQEVSVEGFSLQI